MPTAVPRETFTPGDLHRIQMHLEAAIHHLTMTRGVTPVHVLPMASITQIFHAQQALEEVLEASRAIIPTATDHA